MMKRGESLSLSSRGARHHIGIAMALITVLPGLVVFYLVFVERRSADSLLAAAVLVPIVVSITLGYVLLSRYPVNIVRLRRYLEDIVHGRLPEKVTLLRGMDDIPAIEHSMGIIVEQLSRRVERTREINERLQREIEERRKAERLKDEFVSTVSHELRTPLAISSEGMSLLLDGIPGTINARQEQVLASAKRSLDRLTRIINDLLDISKIEAGRMEIRRGRTDLAELIRQAAGPFERRAADKGLELKLELPGEPLEVYADGERLIQVLTNLLSNAIKFTKEGSVTVSAAVRGRDVECRVRDTGIGISEDDLPRLFDKFVQFGRTNGAGQKGTGLGLAIAKHIVELHGGRIVVQSVLHGGTTFTWTIPRGSADEVLMGEMATRLDRARASDRGLTLFLFEVRPATGTDFGDGVQGVGQALGRLVQSGALARGGDLVRQRGETQVLVMAEIRPGSVDEVVKRWQNCIRDGVRQAVGTVAVEVGCGRAGYPEHGSAADELLRAAEAAIQQKEEIDPVDPVKFRS